MKTIAKTILTLFLAAASSITIAQDYKTGIGLRLGVQSAGFNIKGFLTEKSAIEGIAAFGRHSFITTGLYEYHIPAANVNGLNFYVGGGLHVGYFGERGRYYVYKHKGDEIYVVENGNPVLVPGVDFVFGAEYKFRNAPFAVGIDLKPFIDFHDGAYVYPDAAINGRFVF